MAITAIEGMGGIGKTAIGIVVANELRDEGLYPDGVPFVDLEGFSATREPLSTKEALEALLRPIVGAEAQLPEEDQALQQLWKQQTADRRMLLFLDNARDETQIRPLLPGHPSCKVLATSRNRLDLHGITPIRLGVMEEDKATDLAYSLGNRWQAGRVSREQAAELARLCGYLPLPIEVTAGTLGKALLFNVDIQLQKLAQVGRDALGMAKVKAVLAVSIDQLSPELRTAWQKLGVFEGDFSMEAAAAVIDDEAADEKLAELEQRHLLTLFGQHRLQLHDILRALALESLPAEGRETAEARHAEYFCGLLARIHNMTRTESFGERVNAYGRDLNNILAAEHWIGRNFNTDNTARELASRISDLDLSLFFVRPRRQQIERSRLGLKAGNKLGLAVFAFEYANWLPHRRRGNREEVVHWYQRSRILFNQIGLKEGLAEASSRLGSFLTSNARECAGEIAGALRHAEDLVTEATHLYGELGWNRYLGTELLCLADIKRGLGKAEEAQRLVAEGDAALEAFHGPNRLAMAQGQYDLLPREETEQTRLVSHWKHQLHDFRSMAPEIWEKEIPILHYWQELDRRLPVNEAILGHQE